MCGSKFDLPLKISVALKCECRNGILTQLMINFRGTRCRAGIVIDAHFLLSFYSKLQENIAVCHRDEYSEMI